MHFSFLKREFEKLGTSKPKKKREDGDSDEDMSDDEGILGIYQDNMGYTVAYKFYYQAKLNV